MARSTSGVKTFTNPSAVCSDGVALYRATLRFDRKQIVVVRSQAGQQDQRKVIDLPHEQTQSVAIVVHAGRVIVQGTVLGSGEIREWEDHDSGFAAATVAPPTPPAGGDNAAIKAQLHTLVDQIR